MKRLIVFTLALAAWAYPIHAASAIAEPETNQEFINYEKIRENSADTKKLLHTTKARSTPKQTSYSGRDYSKEEVQELIMDYSARYGIRPDTPLCIAKHESGFNQFSANKSSSARGVFQYLSGTWNATDEGKAGLSVFDADANVRAAVKYMAIHKRTTPWVVHTKCPPLKFIN